MQKGGVGKSVLAAQLAVAAEADGERVVGLDLDPQGSFFNWFQRRKAPSPTAERADPADASVFLARARERGASIAILDTPGVFNAGVMLALQQAHLCLVPLRPALLDVEAARPTVDALKRLAKPFAFVLNQCSAASQARTLDAANALVRDGSLAPAMITSRTDFLDAMSAGQGVTEFGSKSKGGQEIALLWQWLKTQLRGHDYA
jgi:chromosome partitioning protein